MTFCQVKTNVSLCDCACFKGNGYMKGRQCCQKCLYQLYQKGSLWSIFLWFRVDLFLWRLLHVQESSLEVKKVVFHCTNTGKFQQVHLFHVRSLLFHFDVHVCRLHAPVMPAVACDGSDQTVQISRLIWFFEHMP